MIYYLLSMLFLAGSWLYAEPLPHNAQALRAIYSLDHNQSQFSFVVMGDNRDGDKVLREIIRQTEKDKSVLFGIDGGDLVPNGYKSEYTHYLEMLRQTHKPILTVIGNHELPWYGGETNYTHFMGKPYDAFAFGNSYFIMLDDSDEKGLGDIQYKWLIQQLERAKNYAHRFVFMHVPLYDPRKGEYGQGHSLKKRKNAEALNDLFDCYHVSMLFASHIHMYFRGQWHGTPFIITGGAGAPLKHYKKSGFYHYIKITITDDKVSYQVIPLTIPEPSFLEESYQGFRDLFNIQ